MDYPSSNDGDASKGHVEFKSVSKAYGEEWERQEVIADPTLGILPGALTVVGAFGLRQIHPRNLIAGFERPDSGEIALNRRRITEPSKDRMVVFQEADPLPNGLSERCVQPQAAWRRQPQGPAAEGRGAADGLRLAGARRDRCRARCAPPPRLLISRWEPDAMGALPWLVERYKVPEVLSYAGLNPPDFFEGLEEAAPAR